MTQRHWVANPSTSPECGCGWPYYGPTTITDIEEFKRMTHDCGDDPIAAVEQHIALESTEVQNES